MTRNRPTRERGAPTRPPEKREDAARSVAPVAFGPAPAPAPAPPAEPTPIELFAAEAERAGYPDLDPKSVIYGFILGREWPLTDERVRWIAEALLSPYERGSHLPRPGD